MAVDCLLRVRQVLLVPFEELDYADVQVHRVVLHFPVGDLYIERVGDAKPHFL